MRSPSVSMTMATTGRPPAFSTSPGEPLSSTTSALASAGSVRVTAIRKCATAIPPTTGFFRASALPPPSPCHDVLVEKRNQPCGVAASRGVGEAAQQRAMALTVDGKPRPLLDHVRARPAENLATGDGISLNHRGDLFEGKIERVAQHEHDALSRREAFEHDEQGERYVFGTNAGFALGQEGLRQPLADIGFAPRMLIAEPIEAEPRGDGREIGLERAQRILWLGIMQAHEGVLHDLFGVSPVASDPVGQREHGRTQLGEGAIEGHAVWTFWAVRTRCIASFAWCHDTRRRPGQKQKPG